LGNSVLSILNQPILPKIKIHYLFLLCAFQVAFATCAYAHGGIEVTGPDSVIEVQNSVDLDPQPGKIFVVSFKLYLQRLPKIGVRQNIFSKYSAKVLPYEGWAIALQRYSTSVRPEVYLRDQDGRGGWHTFDTIELKSQTWYSMTMVVKAGDFVRLYFGAPDNVPSDSLTVPQSFVGGASLKGFNLEASKSNLFIGATNAGRKGFRGRISSVLVATLPEKTIFDKKLENLFATSSANIVAALAQEDIKLWIDKASKDESRFSRPLEQIGKVSWWSAD